MANRDRHSVSLLSPVLILCPHCASPIDRDDKEARCRKCAGAWPVRDGILVFNEAPYWGEIGRETLAALCDQAERTSWERALEEAWGEQKPVMFQSVCDLNRSAWTTLLPLGSDATVLDIGSGLGAISHGLALCYRRVVSVEAVPERIRFTSIRLRQEGLTHVDLIQTTADQLPLADESFDLIVLNGILEWIGEWIRDRNPRDAQIAFLKKLRKLLKPTGILLIGIENRVGLGSWLGRVDHSGLRYTSLMPRWLAGGILRMKRPGFYRMSLNPGGEYRTYTYSLRGYRRLLRASGLGDPEAYFPPSGYNIPHTLIPLGETREVNRFLLADTLATSAVSGDTLSRKVKRALIRLGVLARVPSDFVLIARRPDGDSLAPPAPDSALAGLTGFEGDPSSGRKPMVRSQGFVNKRILCFTDEKGGRSSIVKQSFRHRTDSDWIGREFLNVQFVDEAAAAAGVHALGPKPLERRVHSNLELTVEEKVPGEPLSWFLIQPRYFRDRSRVQADLEQAVRWLESFQQVFGKGKADRIPVVVPPDWLSQPRECDRDISLGELAEERWKSYAGHVAHGDLFTDNLFLDRSAEAMRAVDWEDFGKGYPLLFDWFTLLVSYYYRLPNVRTRSQWEETPTIEAIFFEDNWLSSLVKRLGLSLCERSGGDSDKIPAYYRDFLCVRYHQFAALRGPKSKFRLFYSDHLRLFCERYDRFLWRSGE